MNSPNKILRSLIVTSCCLLIIGLGSQARAQDASDSPKSSSKDDAAKGAPAAESRIKVVFDENAPGVVYVESGGERIRIDTTKKSIARTEPTAAADSKSEAQLTAANDAATNAEKPAEAAAKDSAKKDSAANAAQNDDDEETHLPERYDYRLVNLPTPKRAPKGSLNLYFTHRFSQPVRPLRESGKTLLGLDSFAVSSFGVSYGITDRLYVSAYRSPLCQTGLCRTIEIGAGYHLFHEGEGAPLTAAVYTSVEGDENFSQRYTYNLQMLFARSATKYVTLFFSPAVHFDANGGRRFNPHSEDFFPPTPLADQFKLGKHTGSFGFGANARIRQTVSLLFEYTPRVGFKLGQVQPVFDKNFNVVGFTNESEAEIGFGVQKDIGRHTFTLTFSNTQTTTTSRYNSSNLALPPKDFIIGFNLFRRML